MHRNAVAEPRNDREGAFPDPYRRILRNPYANLICQLIRAPPSYSLSSMPLVHNYIGSAIYPPIYSSQRGSTATINKSYLDRIGRVFPTGLSRAVVQYNCPCEGAVFTCILLLLVQLCKGGKEG